MKQSIITLLERSQISDKDGLILEGILTLIPLPMSCLLLWAENSNFLLREVI